METKLDWIWPAAAAMYDAKHKEFKIFLKSNFHEFFNQSDWFDEKDPEAVFFQQNNWINKSWKFGIGKSWNDEVSRSFFMILLV